MITVPTVLVLGAGASAPYNYPTGKALLTEILNTTINTESLRMYQRLNFEPDYVKNFVKILRRADPDSIDSFLQYQPDFTKIGKIAITKALIPYENEEKLIEVSDWYQHLFRYMRTDFEKLTENQLSIISFNYDRSFEQFLVDKIENTYQGKTPQDCINVVSKFNIIHLYGQMGLLPWQRGEFTRSYKATQDINHIIQSSEQIRIVHEENVANDPLFQQAHDLLIKAKKIYFLGYGYHQLNNDRLGIAKIDDSGKEILGTRLNMTDKEVEEIMRRTGNKIKLDKISSHYKILDFLKHYVIFD